MVGNAAPVCDDAFAFRVVIEFIEPLCLFRGQSGDEGKLD
jgi:hypothetical protein